MGTSLPDRFEPIRLLRKDRASSTFLATDRGLGRNEIIVKIIGKGHFNPDTSAMVDVFSWYRGLRHVFISEILDVGLTSRKDLFYVRAHHPPSEFFTSANTASVKALISAVDFLHSMGRVHGAIKPSNVFAANGCVKIADPWVGQNRTDPKWPKTEEDIRFTAPEVLSGGAVTVDSDLYSLGALLYRFFSGRDPFEDSDLESLKAKYIWAAPRSLLSVSHVSKVIGEIVSNLLHKDPSCRIAALESLKEELGVVVTCASRAPAIGLADLVEKTLNQLVEKPRLRMVLIESPAGMGKTRLVEELQNRASLSGYSWVTSESFRKGRDPYSALVRRATSLVAENRLVPGSASFSRLQSFAETEDQPRSKREEEELERDLLGLLGSISRQKRLILVIEDIDRAGRRLTAFIKTMVQQLSDLELSVVVTARASYQALKPMGILREFLEEDFRFVALSPLNDEHAATLSSFLSVDRNWRDQAQYKAAGNPSFLEEYCVDYGVQAIRPVPKALSDTILRLPRQIGRVAEVLSVFEEPVDWEVLSEVSRIPTSNLEESIAYMRRLGLVPGSDLTIQYPDARILLQSKISKARRTELHAKCFEQLKSRGCKDSTLAGHAFQGGLFDLAAGLYKQLASNSFDVKDYRAAGRYYESVSNCIAKNSEIPSLNASDRVKLATCFALQGDKERANEILKQLLELGDVRDDAVLRSSVYAVLASPSIENCSEERVRLLELAIQCLPEDSPQRIHRYRALAIALLSAGKSVQAETVLERIERYIKALPEPQQDGWIEDIRSSILMNQGNFREAAMSLRTRQFALASPGTVSNNLAVCIEQLGDLDESREIQRAALHEAELSGALYTQIVSLSNLGSMEAKLGNIKVAATYFAAAMAKLREVHRRDGAPIVAKFTAAYADMATFSLHRGDFASATDHLSRINMRYAGPFPLERFYVAMTRCEFHLDLGQPQKAVAILDGTRHPPIGGDFFEVETLLVEARLEHPSLELATRLQEAVTTCARLQTRYQDCRVRLALAKVLLELGETQQASKIARGVRETCKNSGYKPLAARALLMVGLTEEDKIEKELALHKSLEEAAEMGLAPLMAECLFALGSVSFAGGDYTDAKNQLSKSLAIVMRLAEALSASQRKSYLSRMDLKEMTALFNEASVRASSLPSMRAVELLDKEGAFFVRLYRLTSGMTAASDSHSALATLVEVLKESVKHPTVIMCGVSPRMTFHPVQGGCSAEIGQRIAAIAAHSEDKPYITGVATSRRRDTAAWIPILSLAMPSGIYVECPPGEPPLDEQEIEFLTIAAAIAGAAFDRICSKGRVSDDLPSSQFHGIVGNSVQIREVHAGIEMAAKNAANVLVEGESGTGKELVARAIHERSQRATRPFIPVDCGALPEGLIEAELFGAKKGAYTGALADRPGLFEAAHGGTIFLDEISNLGIAAQAKLLRVLQEREVRRIGSMTGKVVDVRLIAATNGNLERLVRDGRFRSDLLYRLKVLHILLPPLRERRSDIPLLATGFLERLNSSNQTRKYFGPKVIEGLLAHNYPGNVRELQNAVERSFYGTSGTIITQLNFLRESSVDSVGPDDTEDWFKELTEGRQNFWAAVHDRYKRRDISREKVVALVDFGLKTTRGNYKTMASMLQIPKEEYHRFMDFLRRNRCLLDFRPYRRMNEYGV